MIRWFNQALTRFLLVYLILTLCQNSLSKNEYHRHTHVSYIIRTLIFYHFLTRPRHIIITYTIFNASVHKLLVAYLNDDVARSLLILLKARKNYLTLWKSLLINRRHTSAKENKTNLQVQNTEIPEKQ
jgi:hypothetical protein